MSPARKSILRGINTDSLRSERTISEQISGRLRRARPVGPRGGSASRPVDSIAAAVSRSLAARAWSGAAALTVALALLLLFGPPRAHSAVVPVDLTVRNATVRVAQGVKMKAWTFNGQVPGPVVRATEGDTVQVTLRNASGNKHHAGNGHSVDFHAAQIAPNVAFRDVPPGQTLTYSFVADRPGVFMYHCGTAPVLEHLGMGLYGMIIVDPAVPRPPATEVMLVQSEFYGKLKKGYLRPSLKAMRKQRPRYVAFNGKASQYVRSPIEVPVGQPVRVYVVDAGPSLSSAFHVVGEVFDSVQPDGNPANLLTGVSTQLVGAGGGALFELSFDQEGAYPFVTHSFRSADAGAVGKFVAR